MPKCIGARERTGACSIFEEVLLVGCRGVSENRDAEWRRLCRSSASLPRAFRSLERLRPSRSIPFPLLARSLERMDPRDRRWGLLIGHSRSRLRHLDAASLYLAVLTPHGRTGVNFFLLCGSGGKPSGRQRAGGELGYSVLSYFFQSTAFTLRDEIFDKFECFFLY